MESLSNDMYGTFQNFVFTISFGMFFWYKSLVTGMYWFVVWYVMCCDQQITKRLVSSSSLGNKYTKNINKPTIKAFFQVLEFFGWLFKLC